MNRTAMLLWAAILALALTLGAAAAAEGEATADVDAPALYELDQENCYFYDLFGDYVRYITKFTNIGGTGL